MIVITNEVLPPEFVAVTMYVVSGVTVVAVPDITPVEVLNERLAGKLTHKAYCIEDET